MYCTPVFDCFSILAIFFGGLRNNCAIKQIDQGFQSGNNYLFIYLCLFS